jgi:hypothetical protein
VSRTDNRLEYEHMEPELYKITAYNSDGQDITVYALPAQRARVRKMLSSEYGGIEEEGMLIKDAPQTVIDQINDM